MSEVVLKPWMVRHEDSKTVPLNEQSMTAIAFRGLIRNTHREGDQDGDTITTRTLGKVEVTTTLATDDNGERTALTVETDEITRSETFRLKILGETATHVYTNMDSFGTVRREDIPLDASLTDTEIAALFGEALGAPATKDRQETQDTGTVTVDTAEMMALAVYVSKGTFLPQSAASS